MTNHIELRNLIGSVPAGTAGDDNLAIALATYFSDHIARPKDDKTDSETGWGEWVMERTNATLDAIVAVVMEVK